jgi:hypothetical protein
MYILNNYVTLIVTGILHKAAYCSLSVLVIKIG